MTYHNENTYSLDLKAVFKIGSCEVNAQQSRCLRSCSRIAEAVSSENLQAVKESCQEIHQRLLVSAEAAMFMAILFNNGGYVQSPQVLSQEAGLSAQKTAAILKEMFEAGLVNQLADSKGLIISSKALMMLQNDETFDEYQAKELLNILEGDTGSLDKGDEYFIDLYCDKVIDSIANNVKKYISDYPESRMAEFYNENNMSDLDDDEFNQFILLCRHFVMDFSVGIKVDIRDSAVKTMINRGWGVLYAAQGESEGELIKQNNMILSVGVCKKLFQGMESIIDLSSIMGQTRMLKWSEIEKKTLFFNEEESNGIQRLYQMAGEEEYQRIRVALKEHHLKAAVSGILYGGPGTGKTELVKQIALSTQRNLLVVDASKLTGSYVGESERNYRDLFRNFRYVEAISSRAPILFIDEADGILGKRIPGAENSRDRTMNGIQNIILDELNDFEGILLATTNLASNLDDAMDRRFLVKIEFHTPDENTRRKIWKSKLPQVAEEDLAIVAREFPFSGGHIDNVATQAVIESIMDGSNTVTLNSLIKYGKNETGFTNKGKPTRIGF